MNLINPFPRMHVSLYVSNLQETLKFYTAFFGIHPEKVKPGYAKFILEKPSLIISFVENPSRVMANFGHLGFQVETPEELEKRRSIARNLGLISSEETAVNCCYALQDKFWVTDPDGIQWEVYYFHQDAEFNDPHFADENTSQCCIPEPKPEKKKIALRELGTEKCVPGSGCCN